MENLLLTVLLAGGCSGWKVPRGRRDGERGAGAGFSSRLTRHTPRLVLVPPGVPEDDGSCCRQFRSAEAAQEQRLGSPPAKQPQVKFHHAPS